MCKHKLILSALITLSLGCIIPAFADNSFISNSSIISYIEGTSTNYNFTTKDSDGTKYWLIQFNTDNMAQNNVQWSTSEIQGYTGSYNVMLPNGKTTTLYYKYTQPSNYSPTSTRITSLTAENSQNKVFQNISKTNTYGSAINNASTSTQNNIISDFINNHTTGSSSYAYGGAIYNSGKINIISGYFKDNYAAINKINSGAMGGVIYNESSGTITTIDGVFVNNYTYSSTQSMAAGGVIDNRGTITNINGLFIGNRAESSGYSGSGSVIRSVGNIEKINASFINNTSSGTRYSSGAIFITGNGASINEIVGDFINNSALTSNSQYTTYGGAIASESTIITIHDTNFIANHVDSTSNNAFGGAIARWQGNITKIDNTNFIANYASVNSGQALGGAIYSSNTSGTIGTIENSSFINNYAQSSSTSGTAQGGAIWTVNNLTFNSTGGYNSRFSGNYVQKGTSGEKLNEAIYINSSSGTLTFNANTNGQYTFDDYINGASGYDVRFTGDTTGVVNLYNDVKNGDVLTDTITMNLANNEIHNYSMRTLNSNANTKWNIDIDTSNISNPIADKIITSTTGSTGKVTINNLNFINGNISDIIDQNLKIQVLSTQNSNIQLALSSAMSETGEVVLSQGAKTAHSDAFSGTANWTDTYNSWNVSTDVMGTIGLATTSTTNDSIGLTVTGTQVNVSDVEQLDTLRFINQSELATRNFNATVDGETYTVTDDLGTTTAGTININGKPDGAENNGTIDLNGHTGFELANDTTLNLTGVNLKSGTNTNATLISVSNADAEVNLTNVTTTGNIVGTTVFDMTTTGTTTLNGATTNVNLSNSGTLTSNVTITGTVTNTTGTFNNNGTIAGNVDIQGGTFNNSAMITGNVNNAGTLTSSATNLGGSITNTNILNLTGALNKNIAGNGTTYVNSALTLNSGAGVTGTLNMNNGNVTVSAGSITSHNIGTLTGSGNLLLDVDYTGSSVAMDTFTATNAGTGTLTITGLNEIGTRKDFSIQVLNGSGDNLKLAIDNAVTDAYHTVDVDTEYAYDPITNPAAWTDVFYTTTTVTTTTRDLYVQNDKTLTYGVTDTDVDVSVAKTGDTLALVNQSATANRSFNSTVEGETYTSDTNLGETKAGVLNINGKPDGAETNGTIDLGTHSGFELSNVTTLNIQNTKLTGSNDLITTSNADAEVNLENTEIDGRINNNAGELNVGNNVKLGQVYGAGTTNINSDFTLDSVITGNKVTLNNDAELSIATTGSLGGASQFVVNSGTVNLQNGVASNTSLGNLVLNGDMNLKIDGNFASKQIDTITVNSITANDNHINISNINILTPTTDEYFTISPIGTMADDALKTQLANTIQYTAGDITMTPIYKYHVGYNPTTTNLEFTRFGGASPKDSNDFNPAVLPAPVAAQAAAAQGAISNAFGYAFQHADTFMANSSAERFAILNSNKYAVNNDKLSFLSTDYNENLNSIDYDHMNRGIWVQPYTSFESINLNNGPSVSAINYGTLVGGDSNFRKLKRGWYNVGSAYVGYNGSQLRYNKVDTSVNGGLLGLTESFYRGNLWTAITATVGAGVASSDTMYGHEDSTMLMTGVASKTGYNFEFKEGKLIIQPRMFVSYSMVNTFDYRNAAGVNIESDPLHTIQINPSLRIIGNLKGWQPYASVGMVWNLLNKTKVRANGISLPEMSTRPYVEYGVGLQRCWKEKYSAYGQAMIRNGGRNGVALTFGFRWALGKDTSRVIKEAQALKTDIKNKKVETKELKQAKVQNIETRNKKVENNKTIKVKRQESEKQVFRTSTKTVKNKETKRIILIKGNEHHGAKHVLKDAKSKPTHKISAIEEK